MRPVAALLCVVALGGCTSLARQTMRASHTAPLALAPAEQRLRDLLRGARWDGALRAAASEKEGGPGDRLLRDLYVGTAAYYAGRWDESGAAFERAATLADDRFTKSASRGALALATSDLALPYVPGQNERLLVHYYALLSWLRRGSVSDAAVEARRLGFLLQRYDDDRTPLDASTRGALRVVAGTVFEAAGDTNDAAVAFRHAAALGFAGAVADAAPRAQRGPRPAAGVDSGDVLVVVEQGFVAHRVEQRLTLRGDDDGDWRLLAGAGERPASTSAAIARAAALLAGDDGLWADASTGALSLASHPASDDALGAAALDDPSAADVRAAALDDADAPEPPPTTARGGWRTRARVVWPAYRRPVALPVAALVVDRGAPTPLPRADLSAAEAGDFRRDRAARLVRLVARAALREGAASELGRKHGEIASIVRGAARAMERADTRSWHLLPGVVSVARVRLPVGEHALAADVGGARVPLGTVTVQAGRLALATTRLWSTGGAVVTPPIGASAAR